MDIENLLKLLNEHKIRYEDRIIFKILIVEQVLVKFSDKIFIHSSCISCNALSIPPM